MAGDRAIRPDGIDYWVDERPPPSLILMVALQQVAFLGAIMTLPVVLARQAGLDMAGAAGLVALTMVGAGIGVILQALNRGGIGIGLFSPLHTSSVAFPAALAAVQMGGLGLAFGMMTVAAVMQMALARFLPRLRALFPVEIAGLIVLILGIGLGLVGLRNFLALDTPQAGDHRILQVGFLTLATIILFNIWGKGRLRAFSVFTGLVVGQALAYWQGLVDAERLGVITQAPLFAVPPIGQFGWAFDWALLPEFLLVGLALSFNCIGVLTIAQRANDAGWKRPDLAGISRGLMAEGLTNAACSLINGVTQTASGGSIGLSLATGVTSRIVGFALGGIFIGLAFFPPIASLWTLLAPPVIGAVLMFIASFVIVGGIKIITSRLLDPRKTLTLGLALIAAIGHDTVLVNLNEPMGMLDTSLSSMVALGVMVAIGLNALFRLGVHQVVAHSVLLDAQWPVTVNKLLWHLGHEWGARPEVMMRLDHATHELLDAVYGQGLLADEGDPRVELVARFDEYQCQVRVTYAGRPLSLAKERPDPERLLDDQDALADLASLLIRRQTDGIKVEANNGQCTVSMRFDD
ncbi:MAG: solute carrier family 23 protein [Chromatiaceae bacterium]